LSSVLTFVGQPLETQLVWSFVVGSSATQLRFFFRVELSIWVNYSRGMIAMLGKKYYTVTQAAELAGVTTGYVRKLLRNKEIIGEKIGDRAWIIPANQLEKMQTSPSGRGGKPRIGKKTS
jgi:excisionase family DNA binding protein